MGASKVINSAYTRIVLLAAIFAATCCFISLGDEVPPVRVAPADEHGFLVKVQITKFYAEKMWHTNTLTVISITFPTNVSQTITKAVLSSSELMVPLHIEEVGNRSVKFGISSKLLATSELILYSGSHPLDYPAYSIDLKCFPCEMITVETSDKPTR